MTGGGSSKKKMVAFSDRIPKKSPRDAKHCALCKQHGGAYNTHNTGECRKYEKDGTPKKSEISAKLLDPELLGAHLNSVIPPSIAKKMEESLLL